MLRRSLRTKRSFCFLLLAVSMPDVSAWSQKIPPQYQAQIDQQASLATAQAAKIVAKLLTSDIHAGSTVQVQIALINMENKAITARDDWKCDVSIRFPSGKTVDQVAWIKKNGLSGQFEFTADEPGLVSVFVRPTGDSWPAIAAAHDRSRSGSLGGPARSSGASGTSMSR